VEIYQLQNTAGAFFSKSDAIALNQLVSKLSTITAGKQQEVAQIINGLNQITGVINARKTQVSELIDAANVLATTVANHDQQLVSAIDNLQTVLGGLSKESLYVKYLIDNTDQVATQVGDVIGHNQPQLQSLLNNLHSVLQVVSTHQVDLAEAISYLDSAITGFASVGKSGNVSVPWANQFLNVSSSLGIDTVLGNCGLMSQALNDILGPDPLPCNQGMGPLPTPSSGASTSSLGDSPIKSSNISGADTSANPIANLLSSVSGGN
jgi:ABC-type transporter Mla subunit MlaD